MRRQPNYCAGCKPGMHVRFYIALLKSVLGPSTVCIHSFQPRRRLVPHTPFVPSVPRPHRARREGRRLGGRKARPPGRTEAAATRDPMPGKEERRATALQATGTAALPYRDGGDTVAESGCAS